MKTRNILCMLGIALAATLTSCATGGAAGSSGVKPYTKNECIVTGNTLGSMGDPISEVYQGQEVKFCCKACIAKFHKDPAKYMAKL